MVNDEGPTGPQEGASGHQKNQDARREILQVFKRGAEFTEELLEENERLRFRVAELENERLDAEATRTLVENLKQRATLLESEKSELVDRFAQVERENRDFAERHVNIEQENNNLLNIYVASYQLHSTLDFEEVVGAIAEVILNFVGAEVFLLGMVDGVADDLQVLVNEGLVELSHTRLNVTNTVMGEVLRSGEARFVEEIDNLTVSISSPAICIPLKIKEDVIGVIALYKFLQQKKRLASLDHELFTLLAGHAATALFASRLYTDSKRKLNTIQGFIDLVTS